MTPSDDEQVGVAGRTDVLLVDDSVTDLKVLMSLMILSTLRLSIATTGERGLHQARALQPNLILLDVHMPGMGGFEVCRALKSDALTRAIPVIFLTAATDLSERLEGFAVGGVDYIGKPFEAQEVLARVGVHLRRRGGEDPTAGGSTSPARDGEGKHPLHEREATLVGRAQAILVEHMTSPPRLDALVRQLATNRRTLNDAFQSFCGQPVFGWLRDERLRQAHALVTGSDRSFSQISEQLGFSTPANFSKAFRQRYGCTPSDVRQRLQSIGSPREDHNNGH